MFAEVSEMERTVLHCDCNSFFASVETVAHPEYSKVPMAVCGSVENRHGIVLAKNEFAKKADRRGHLESKAEVPVAPCSSSDLRTVQSVFRSREFDIL